MLQRLAGFLRDEDGPTAAEYAMLLALILAVVITAIQAVGNTSSGLVVQRHHPDQHGDQGFVSPPRPFLGH